MSDYTNGSTMSTCKRVRYDYALQGSGYEAGLVLTGPEVSFIRTMGLHVSGARVWLEDNEAWVHLDTALHPDGPTRSKIKLLLNGAEIRALHKAHLAGCALLVESSYITPKGKIKIRVIPGKLQKRWDKREAIKERDIKRKGE